MKSKYLLIYFLIPALYIFTACSGQPDPAGLSESELVEYAKQIHGHAITIDTHVDINPANFTAGRNYLTDQGTQVDIPKMETGGLDAVFFIVYTGQGPLTEEGFSNAYNTAMGKFEAIHRLAEEIAPDRLELALTAADVRRIHESGKRIALIGIENGYPIGMDIGNVKKFYDLGGRYMSLAHNGHSQLSDSNTGERNDVWLHNGLSDLGKQVITEMNKWGIMVDISHPSKEAILQMMELSKAPVIASHSSCRELGNHSRNLDDELLMALKKNNGVAQMVALGGYVKETPEEKSSAYTDLYDQYGIAGRRGLRRALENLNDEAKTKFESAREAIETKWPSANVKDFVDHIDYAVKLIGIEHVGISSDFDGGGGITDWNDASETFNVTLELVRRGYSEEEIKLLWGGNLLRVMEEVELVAKAIQSGEME